MINLIKIVFFKELRETLRDIKFILIYITIIMLFAVTGLVIDYYSKDAINYLIILLSPITMWIISFHLIKEKIKNIKDDSGFNIISTLPLSLHDILVSKFLAIFVLSYPSTFLTAIILTKGCFLTGQNPFTMLYQNAWLFIFVVCPVLIMIYNIIISGIALRFETPHIAHIHEFSIIICIVLIFGFNVLSKLHETLNLMNGTLIFVITIIWAIFIMHCVINNLKKEDLINYMN